MSVIPHAQHGRLLTIVNRSSRVIGAVGTTIPAGGSKTVRLAKVQGSQQPAFVLQDEGGFAGVSQKYMDELNAHVAAGRISMAVNGVPVKSSTDAAALDVPLDGALRAARDVWNNLAAADVDAIKTAFQAPAAATTYSAANFNGVVGAGEMVPPRNVTFKGTTGVGEALAAKTAVITGLDLDGQVRIENVSLSVLGASDTATNESVAAFSRILSVYLPADASGTPGDYEIGFGNKVGLARPLTVGGVMAEFTNNAIPGTAGTVVLSGVSVPNGTFTPDTAPNGTNDYIVVYVPGA